MPKKVAQSLIFLVLFAFLELSSSFLTKSVQRREVSALVTAKSHHTENLSATQTLSPDDDFFRTFRRKVPVSVQSFMRDSGLLRLLVDTLTWTTAATTIVKEEPEALPLYLHLSGLPSSLVNLARKIHDVESSHINVNIFEKTIHFESMHYGEHPRQYVDIMRLGSKESRLSKNLLVFVHGGAWGSGSPEMYRLVACPFLEYDMEVAVLGYRTYPDTNAEGQVDDIIACIEKLRTTGVISPETEVTLMGHSSGAHILSMALLQNKQLRETATVFVGLSGVYDIPKHYKFERTRGVERFSPLATACSMTSVESPGLILNSWKRLSPSKVAREQTIPMRFPSTLIFHGERDGTVPIESSLNFAEALSRAWETSLLQVKISEGVSHADVVTDLMFGGPSRDAVLSWMKDFGVIGRESENEMCKRAAAFSRKEPNSVQNSTVELST